ncbi:ATP-binding protein [Halorhodospira halophila]|uniref:ATP-binding protein n=1 Tax=Halorhodospira halophila TaxID=1053 RepID=UPI0019125796|nr:ATP-binding protein [Halorhodospira halophila]MBK5943962.1 AAA family ATPase [Halorhodospira halophila]
MDRLEQFLDRAERLLERIEPLLPPAQTAPDWDATTAFRWQRRAERGYLEPIAVTPRIELAHLHGIERQKTTLLRNTRQHLAGLPANNALLWGARGTGKSSLIQALHRAFAAQGLRLIEMEPEHLTDLPRLLPLLAQRPERFIVYCDDLSFDASDHSYRALKAVLDGSLSGCADNVLLYATSNRRHLVPEQMADNDQARISGGELHHGDGVEERISLSERFGVRLSFHPFAQERYLEIVGSWIEHLGGSDGDSEAARQAALAYALDRGSRSGRVAWQFARDWVGRQGLPAAEHV